MVANHVGLAVQRKVFLIAAEPALRIGCPAHIAALWSVVAAVDDRHRTALFAEVSLASIATDVEVAVLEERSCTKRAPHGLGTIEVEVAMAIDSMSAVQSVVGTLEVAVFVIGVSGTVQRIQVQATDKAYLLGY